jgi:hypothetical protein
MPFGETADEWVEFNTYEALFWLVLGASIFVFSKWNRSFSRPWVYFTTYNIVLFGVTDVVEIYTGGFLDTAQWLLYWKVVHVCGLFISLVWYVCVCVYDRR